MPTKMASVGAKLQALTREEEETPITEPDTTPVRKGVRAILPKSPHENASNILKTAVSEALQQPRISLWGPDIKTIYKIKKLTVPGYTGKEMRKYILEGYKRDEPELYNVIMAALKLEP